MFVLCSSIIYHFIKQEMKILFQMTLGTPTIDIEIFCESCVIFVCLENNQLFGLIIWYFRYIHFFLQWLLDEGNPHLYSHFLASDTGMPLRNGWLSLKHRGVDDRVDVLFDNIWQIAIFIWKWNTIRDPSKLKVSSGRKEDTLQHGASSKSNLFMSEILC